MISLTFLQLGALFAVSSANSTVSLLLVMFDTMEAHPVRAEAASVKIRYARKCGSAMHARNGGGHYEPKVTGTAAPGC